MIWIIEESPNPSVWYVLQSRGIYKTEARATQSAKELQRWHREELKPGNVNYGKRFRAVPYGPLPTEATHA
jgi:hypothetical protein